MDRPCADPAVGAGTGGRVEDGVDVDGGVAVVGEFAAGGWPAGWVGGGGSVAVSGDGVNGAALGRGCVPSAAEGAGSSSIQPG